MSEKKEISNGVECIFCKIIDKEEPADIEYEDEEVIVIKNIRPVMEIHSLVIPKKHIESIMHLEDKDKELMGKLILVAKKVAKDRKLKGYKLAINVGRDGGQIIDHIHMHLLSGNKLCH